MAKKDESDGTTVKTNPDDAKPAKPEERDDEPKVGEVETDKDRMARLVEFANKNRTNANFVEMNARDFCWLTDAVGKCKLDKDEKQFCAGLIKAGKAEAKKAEDDKKHAVNPQASDVYWLIKIAIKHGVGKA